MAVSHRLKRYNSRCDQYKQNNLFRNQPGRVYQQFANKPPQRTNDLPDRTAVHDFWGKLWGVSKQHNTSPEWLTNLQKKYCDVSEQDDVTIIEFDVASRVKRMANWKAPGLDCVQVYWLKHLSGLHLRLAKQFQDLLDQQQALPQWLVTGRTTLIMKDPNKGPVASNYRPITCLPTTWKLLSGIMADKLIQHLDGNNIMASEQKGIMPGGRGSKTQLLIDKMVCLDSKRRRTNLAVAWIDFQKAFDSVPHSWILEVLSLYKVNSSLVNFISASMNLWNTMLTVNELFVGNVSINCGIFQGDSLSPLLFCLALNPLSEIIQSTPYGYKFRSGILVQHLLYMDDLKLYGRNENDLNLLLQTVSIYCEDINMTINLKKSAVLVVSRGKMSHSSGIELGRLGKLDCIGETPYKYLGILQDFVIQSAEVKGIVLSEYYRRCRKILSSKLCAINKCIAINSYALPVVSYTGGIVKWTVDELAAADRKTRKLFTIYKGLHPRADVDRLYLPRNCGGRNLRNVKESILIEEHSLAHYVWTNSSQEPLIKALQESGLFPEPTTSLSSFKSDLLQSNLLRWKEKPLHGQYPTQVELLTTVKCAYKWLCCCNLKIETEALLTAAQDQALCVRSYSSFILHSTDPLCRLCGNGAETIFHLLSACSCLAATEYLNRHNAVASILHRNICSSYHFPVHCDKPWLYQPEPVLEGNGVKILWDFDIRTDHIISARRPDIVIVDYNQQKGIILDVAIPADINIATKEQEKVVKYQQLRLELEKLWNVKFTIIPIVVGALGSFTPNLLSNLKQLPGTHIIQPLVKAALLGSAHIMRKVLDLHELG